MGGGAGAAVTWTQVSTGDVVNFVDAALHRTPDGVLHVMWPEDNEDGTADVLHATVTADGTVTPPTNAQSSWVSIWGGGGDLVPTADGGLAYFFGGRRSSVPEDPNDNLNMITSDATGATWDVHVGDISPPATTAYASTVGAAVDSTMTPYQIWGSTVHRGLDPASPATSFQGAAGFGCCAYNGALATDLVTGTMYAAWYSNDGPPSATNNGVWVQEVDTTDGTPVGVPARFPGSVTLYNGTEQSSDAGTRIPMAERVGGGVYVAWPTGYPSQRKLVVWRPFDTGGIAVASGESDIDDPAIAAAPDGRIWVAWTQGGKVRARRSNVDVTQWGAVVKAPFPAGQDTKYDLKADAGDGSLDVIGDFDGPSNSVALFHARFFPGLKIVADPGSVRREGRVTFTVTDAGDPVEGVTVTIGGRDGVTNAAGEVSIRVGPYNRARRLTATATKAGYTRGKTTVRVRV